MRLTLAVLIVVALVAGPAVASDEELLDSLWAGLYARGQSMKTCQGSVHLVTIHPLEEGELLSIVQTLTVACDGERLRMSSEVQTGAAASFEGLDDGEQTTLWLHRPGAAWHVQVYDEPDTIMHGMFSLHVDPRKIGSLPLSGPVRAPNVDARVTGRETVNGHACVVVELAAPISKTRLWVDPEAGHAVRKLQGWYLPDQGDPVLMLEQVVELRDYGDGLWGPDTYTRWDWRPDGTLEDKTLGRYDFDFRINAPIDEEAFDLIPPGLPIVHEDEARSSTGTCSR